MLKCWGACCLLRPFLSSAHPEQMGTQTVTNPSRVILTPQGRRGVFQCEKSNHRSCSLRTATYNVHTRRFHLQKSQQLLTVISPGKETLRLWREEGKSNYSEVHPKVFSMSLRASLRRGWGKGEGNEDPALAEQHFRGSKLFGMACQGRRSRDFISTKSSLG